MTTYTELDDRHDLARELVIDWTSARVELEVRTGELTLTVRLTAAPDSYWQPAFDELRRGWNREVAGASGREIGPLTSERALLVSRIRPGDEPVIAEALDEMVASANAAAQAHRDREAAEKRAAEDAEAQGRQHAADMTARFRSRVHGAFAGSESGFPEPEAAELDPDLRARFRGPVPER
jgi:hypothetical protein